MGPRLPEARFPTDDGWVADTKTPNPFNLVYFVRNFTASNWLTYSVSTDGNIEIQSSKRFNRLNWRRGETTIGLPHGNRRTFPT